MSRQRSFKGKKQYGSYKTENRVTKNKIKKLEKHCKRFPDDAEAKKNLARIKKDGYKCRAKPLEPGSNKTRKIIRLDPIKFPDTPGEQLSKLLGIKLPKARKRTKPKIVRKKRRNVKT